jgi:Domain of unknown function (DUF4386)
MMSAQSRGRIIGMMLLAQLAGLIVPFVLLHPMTTSDFLANAAAYSSQIKLAVFLLLVNCALTICISLLAFPIFREHSVAAALLLVSASVIMFSLQAVDNAHLMSMLSLSQEYVQGGGSDERFQTLALVVRSARKWTHYSELLAIDSWFFTLYGFLCRYPLVPRAIAFFGLATVLIHFMAIPLPLFLGYSGMPLLGVLMAFSHTALAVWLLARGFEGRPQGEAK